MSTAIFDNFQGPNNRPAHFPFGIRVGSGHSAGINDIGVPGSPGFGVGICPGPLPVGMSPMNGYDNPLHYNYGNYTYSDGSVMVWIPAFYTKWGTGSNGLPLNDIDIKSIYHFSSDAEANAQGYALDRAFWDGGSRQLGVFVDKYQNSNNGGILSSLRNKSPIASGGASGSLFSHLNGSIPNTFAGAILAPKTRGPDFFCNSRFIFTALARLSLAHGQASTSTVHCAWYHPIHNFPKGCNNNALGDANDPEVRYVSSDYENKGLTGSANNLAKTTHNGQMCGVADLNGNIWEVTPCVTVLNGTKYILKTSTKMSTLTEGTTLDTDLWGAAGVAKNYEPLGGAADIWDGSGDKVFGNAANQVFSPATSGLAWAWAGAGGMTVGGDGGTNKFGNDRMYNTVQPEHTCPASGGLWNSSTAAGVWTLNLNTSRTHSAHHFGLRSALYL